jgi:hypothetical protein
MGDILLIIQGIAENPKGQGFPKRANALKFTHNPYGYDLNHG